MLRMLSDLVIQNNLSKLDKVLILCDRRLACYTLFIHNFSSKLLWPWPVILKVNVDYAIIVHVKINLLWPTVCEISPCKCSCTMTFVSVVDNTDINSNFMVLELAFCVYRQTHRHTDRHTD